MFSGEEIPNMKHYLKINLTKEGLQKALQALKTNKSSGLDVIHAKGFKETSPVI